MSLTSQRVTKVDLANGRIRLPHEAKVLFPAERSYVSIVLRGHPMEVRYDPRVGPDEERSAVLGIWPRSSAYAMFARTKYSRCERFLTARSSLVEVAKRLARIGGSGLVATQ